MSRDARTTLSDCKLVDLPKIQDPRGNLTFIDGDDHVPFTIERAFWIYDVPGGAIRGGHAYRSVTEFIVALSGSFDVLLDDGVHKSCYTLNRSYYGLLVPGLIWRQMINFSTNAVALVLASRKYDENDYVRHYNEFLAMKKAP